MNGTLDRSQYYRQARAALAVAVLGGVFVLAARVPGFLSPMLVVSLCALLCTISVALDPGTAATVVDGVAAPGNQWQKNCRLGGSLALAVAAALGVVIVGTSGDSSGDHPLWLSAAVDFHFLIFLSLEAFAWGMFWSRPGQTVLTAFALSVLSLFLVWWITTIGGIGSPVFVVRALVVRCCLACTALYFSSRSFWPLMNGGTNLTGVIAWKEFREHRSVWLAMAVLNAAVMFGVRRLLHPLDVPQVLYVVAIVFPAAYGLVCAGMMLAGESESGALAYLDATTRTRTALWIEKCLLGVLYTLGQAMLASGLLAIFVSRLPGTEPVLTTQTWDTIPAIIIAALAVFALGMFVSARSRTVLGAGARGAVPAGLMLSYFANLPDISTSVVVGASSAGLALYGSWRWFCSADVDRATTGVGPWSGPSAVEAAHAHGVMSVAVLAFGLGAVLGLTFLLVACAITMPLLRTWQMPVAITALVWLAIIGKGVPGGRPRVRLEPRARRRQRQWIEMCQAAVTAAGMALVLLCALCMFTVDVARAGAISPTLESMMPILPAGSIILASWVALCRDKATEAQPPTLPGWLVAAWILFIAFGVSVYMVDSKGHFNGSRVEARNHSVDGAASWLAVWR